MVKNEKERLGKLFKSNGTDRNGKHFDLSWLGKIINDVTSGNQNNNNNNNANSRNVCIFEYIKISLDFLKLII